MSEQEKELGAAMLGNLAGLDKEALALVRGFVEGVRAASTADGKRGGAAAG